MNPSVNFSCSICGEQSTSICVYCTKDACPNHLCDRCRRCSDCCECDIRLESGTHDEPPAASDNHATPPAEAPHEPPASGGEPQV